MRNIFIFMLALLLFGCANRILNATYQQMGVFDDYVEIVRATKSANEVVFIPMKHVGTPMFYDDVKKTVDSLTSEGFFFYYEGVKTYLSQDEELRKYRKITGKPLATKGYMYLLDSVMGDKYNVKLKKKIIDQPSYRLLGVDSSYSKNVDASLAQMIKYYEARHGLTILEDCDYKTEIFDESICKDKRLKKSIRDELLIHSRNQIVLVELKNEIRNKIAIIYGEGHIPSMLEGLKEYGYQIVDAPPE